jgi:hypothetical protein
MVKKPLVKTNPHLKDPEKRQAMIYEAVSSSTAIEGVHVPLVEAVSQEQAPAKPPIPRKREASSGSRR